MNLVRRARGAADIVLPAEVNDPEPCAIGPVDARILASRACPWRSSGHILIASLRGMEPEVAIVTPSLDQVRYLGACVASVRDQPGVVVEHTIIDGGSSDGTLALLAHLERPGLRWWSGPDAGQADAVNKGIALTTAPVVGWLNADDEYAPGAIAAARDVFEADASIDVVYGDCVEIDAHGREGRVLRARGMDPLHLLRGDFMLYQPTFFFRRSALETLGPLDAGLHLVLDYDLILRAALRCRSCRIDRVMALHRRHGEAKTSRRALEFHAEYRRVLDRTFDVPALPKALRRLRPEAYRHVELEGGARALEAGDRALARARLRRALLPPGSRTLRASLLLVDAWLGSTIGRAVVDRLRRIA